MRSVPAVVPALVLVLPFVWGFAASDDFNGASGNGAMNLPTSTSTSDSDAAAARHAKRTACLKQAKARKLVGPNRSAFIKECVAAP